MGESPWLATVATVAVAAATAGTGVGLGPSHQAEWQRRPACAGTGGTLAAHLVGQVLRPTFSDQWPAGLGSMLRNGAEMAEEGVGPGW